MSYEESKLFSLLKKQDIDSLFLEATNYLCQTKSLFEEKEQLQQENQQLKLINKEYERLGKENGRCFKITSVKQYNIDELIRCKDNWNKLREWLETNWKETQDIWFVKILNKMQELERGVRMNKEKLEVTKEKLGVDEWLELIREDKNLNGAYISICQYVDLTEQENKQLKDNWDELKEDLIKIRQLTFTKYNKNEWANCLSFNDDILPLIKKMQEIEQGSDSNE
nr:MAG TPA: hypothetical protein [Caudoviricetes sp.]